MHKYDTRIKSCDYSLVCTILQKPSSRLTFAFKMKTKDATNILFN